MKIAVISDQHLGFGWDTEREDDPFRTFSEALRRAEDADLILLPGDVFDRKRPRQEVLARAIDCLRQLEARPSELEVAEGEDPGFRGTPVVAIHGTHERRTSDHVNPVELLERMGLLTHLHGDRIVFRHQGTGEQVAVHGMSGVPERYAPDVLDRHDYSPVPDCYNILMLHQSIRNMVYTDEDRPALELGMLPTGFDAIIDGHIHWYNLDHRDDERPLLLPGSTITTQINQIEAERPKGFLMLDTGTGEVEFIALEESRDVVHETVDVTGMTGSTIRERVTEIADQAATGTDQAPLVRIRLRGTTAAEVSVTELERSIGDRVLPSITADITRPDGDAADVDVSEDSARRMGQELLADHVGFDVEELLDRFIEDDPDEALSTLEEMDEDELRAGLDDEPDAPGEEVDGEVESGKDDGSTAESGDETSSTADDGPESDAEEDETEERDPTIRRFTEL